MLTLYPLGIIAIEATHPKPQLSFEKLKDESLDNLLPGWHPASLARELNSNRKGAAVRPYRRYAPVLPLDRARTTIVKRRRFIVVSQNLSRRVGYEGNRYQ